MQGVLQMKLKPQTKIRILTLTSCTGEKAVDDPRHLVLEDFGRGPQYVAERENELGEMLRPAGEMYTGQQHVRLMRGVAAYRQSTPVKNSRLDLHILSAGYGIISEHRKIAPYEFTFAAMKMRELADWAKALHVPEEFRTLIAKPYDFGLILLGDNYLKACALDAAVKFGGPTMLFCGTGMAKKLPPLANVRVITLSNPEAKRFSCGLVGLKGELAKRLLEKLASEATLISKIMDPATDVLASLNDDVSASVPKHTRALARANPAVDQVIHIPDSWWQKPHRSKLRYFIPEWDDLVDPDYDFLTDTHSGGSGDWSNEVYAHQMYPEPNYDGILVSRAIAEKSRKKKERINALGVHRFLRVPRGFPIMGDCGAFDYIMQERPPYSTEDVLDYYTRLDFDFGVSVDHLIVTATEAQKEFRYNLTIHNAEDFLKQHRAAGLKWEPIGAVQGWDADSYAKAAAQYVKMGYRCIALGGLVRTPMPAIQKIVRKVKGSVGSGIGMHLFGIARLAEAQNLSNLGVTSVDSASPMRRAWLGAKDNYRALSGEKFRAIRVPGIGKSFRAKRMVGAGRISFEDALALEAKCLAALRAYNHNQVSLEHALELVDRLDRLIGEDRLGMIDDFRKTLEAKPWKDCPCAICKKWGIEVIIFRGNNRNRRRGFHNTYVFYQHLQDVLNGKRLGFLEDEEGGQLQLPELANA
jgi:Queuine tRNA-ribosyltransferase